MISHGSSSQAYEFAANPKMTELLVPTTRFQLLHVATDAIKEGAVLSVESFDASCAEEIRQRVDAFEHGQAFLAAYAAAFGFGFTPAPPEG
jgi:hypothetical protein